MKILSPSLLSADFARLGEEAKMLNSSNATWAHFDVMDGVFVRNITFGVPLIKKVSPYIEGVVDTHLMIVKPENYVEQFVKAGSDYVTFHIEATEKAEECIETIKRNGAKAGISIKPNTPVSAIEHLLSDLDMILVMTVEPGFGNQKLMTHTLDKVKELKQMREERGYNYLIQIDGGVTTENAASLYEVGCDVIVAGSAVFEAENPHEAINKILGI